MSLTIKKARLLCEKTQNEMANLLGVHVQTYRKIEQKPGLATVAQAKKISEVLGVDYNDIFFG